MEENKAELLLSSPCFVDAIIDSGDEILSRLGYIEKSLMQYKRATDIESEENLTQSRLRQILEMKRFIHSVFMDFDNYRNRRELN